MAKKKFNGITAVVTVLFLGNMSVFAVTSYAQKTSYYKEFNKWGIVFKYPKSFTEFPKDQLNKFKVKSSEELASTIEEGQALCGKRVIEELTIFSSDDMKIGLGVTKIRFIKEPTPDRFLHERKSSLSNVPPKGFEIKPGQEISKIWRLEKTQISGYNTIIEDWEKINSRNFGLHIIKGKTVYDIVWIVDEKNKFKNYEKDLIHLIKTIKLKK